MTSTVSYFLLALSASLILLTCGQQPKVVAQGKEKTCLNYMEDCNPWSARCCEGMKCLNLRKGWCGLERCVCQRNSYFSLDRIH